MARSRKVYEGPSRVTAEDLGRGREPLKSAPKAVEEILAQRSTTHGDFTENARLAQEIMRVLNSGPSWGDITDVQKEALHMIAHKMARIVGGNPDIADHWDDIAGYATLVSQRVS